MTIFSDRLIGRMRTLRHPLCVGLDPHLDLLPRPFRRGSMAPQEAATAAAVEEFCCRAIDLVAEDVAIVKPQAALFERLGWQGWRALERVVRYARNAGLLVLLDAKRGDIPDTAIAYAQAYLAPDAPCGVDAMTVNPYLGPESLAPFMLAAEQAENGVIVLVRNSNPDSAEYQTAVTHAGPFFMVVARSLVQWQQRLGCGASGWSSLGVTVAANHADSTERVREILPHVLFLVPGYGAQGVSAREAVHAFRRGPAGLEGGIVSSSRAILFPPKSLEGGAREWDLGVRAALTRAINELGEAVA